MNQVPFLLIALALGFWVLTLADNNANPLRVVGRIVGWVILLVAVAGLICAAMCGLCRMKSCSKSGMAMGGGCPMSMSAGCHKMGKMDCARGEKSAMPEDVPQK